jgi:23S rRNA (cytidine1920-2'-O)/16S rRNA (cytidine1409-2'-O)-methyltransferase
MKRAPDLSLKHRLMSTYPLTEEEAFAMILCGEVRINGHTVTNPNAKVNRQDILEVKSRARFVSRGGDKLHALLKRWEISIAGKVFLDAGCSTGGFTDCLLRMGARCVHAVDVGYNQLAYSLRVHPKVRVHERANIMKVSRSLLEPPPDAAVADLSFRSIEGAASHMLSIVEDGWLICLVKPQFEWKGHNPAFRGVVTDAADHLRILFPLVERLWQEGSIVNRVALSILPGRRGNREFFFLIKRTEGADIEAIKEHLRAEVLKGFPG